MKNSILRDHPLLVILKLLSFYVISTLTNYLSLKLFNNIKPIIKSVLLKIE